MSESTRGKGGSLFAWLLLGVLAIAFGFTFGLPSDQLSLGDNGLVEVHGEKVRTEDFAYQSSAIAVVLGGLPEGEQAAVMGVREEVLEAVIERLVLSELGSRLGLATELRDAEKLTQDGFMVVLGEDVPFFPWVGTDEFDYKGFKSYIGQFGVSEPRYLELQRQELLAQQVRELIAASVVVPEFELYRQYEKDNNQLALRYVRFASNDYAELVDPTPEEIDAYVAEHPDELTEAYESGQARFLKLPAQVKLRLISVPKPAALPEGADEAMQAEWQQRFDATKATLEQARTRIVEGGERFPAVAREVSKDPDTAGSGGLFGWTQVTDTGSGLDPVIDAAAAKLNDGEVSTVLEGETSFYLITVEGHREGDVPEAEAKRELAEEMVRRARGRELAKQAAEEALLAVREGKSLDSLFGAGKPELGKPGVDPIEELPLGEQPKPNAVEPKIEETGLYTYGKPIPGIGAQPELSEAAWAAEADTMLEQVYEVPGGYLIAELDDKQLATKEGYAEARAELYRRAVDQKANAVLSGLTKHECYLGKAKTAIRVNEVGLKKLMNYGDLAQKDEQGNPLTPPYRVCDRVGDRGGLLRLSMLLGGGRRGGGR